MLHRRKIIFITIVVFIIVLCLIYGYITYREKHSIVTNMPQPCSNGTCAAADTVKTQYSSKSTQSGTAPIRVPPVPMLDAAMIQSTASNTAYTTSLAPGATLTVPCGSTPSHIHHGLVAPLGSAVNGVVNYTLSYYDTSVGTRTETGTCNVVWDTQTIGQTTIATIKLPDSLRITASDGLATLSLNATSNGIQLYGLSVPDPVTGSPGIMHHLAGIPQNMITGAMYVPSSFPPQLAKGTWRVPDELGSYESTAQETSVEQDSITINAAVSWNVPSISFFMTMIGTNTFSENVGNYIFDNGGNDSFQLAFSVGATNGLSGNVSSSALTDLQIPGVVPTAGYQLVTVPLGGVLLTGNSIVLSNPLASAGVTGMFTPNAIQPDTVLVDASGSPYYIIGKTTFITRPVGKVTPEQPDVYDTGCYLGADMATGNCVTQRSNSTTCRQNSLCLINSCTIVGTTAPYIGMDSMDTFSPVSEDYGATASVPKSIMPKAWPLPKNMNKLNSAVPQHMLDKSVMAIDTCPCGMYYIPQNTQVDREGLPVNTLYDVYTISVGANNPCPGPGPEATGYPALGDGANGCGPTSAVCSPNTVPTQVPTVGACGDILGNCYYICANSHYSCTAGFVSVGGECYRSPPITLDPSQLSSNMLCSYNIVKNSDYPDGILTCAQNGVSVPTFFNSSGMEANGWRIDPSSCTGGVSGGDPDFFSKPCYEPSSNDIIPFSVDDSIGTATNPIPCGYYYWPASTPSYQLFNVGIYGQSQCTEPAGCTDAIPSYSLGWTGGWVGNT